MFLLPLFLVTQTLQYLDKTALNYAKVFGMEKAMGMSGNQFSLGAAIFYMQVKSPFPTSIALTKQRIHGRPAWVVLPTRSIPRWSNPRWLRVLLGYPGPRYGLVQKLHPRDGHSILPRCL
jgi:hypothetical protein